MKHFICLLSFVAISSSLLSQEMCDNIDMFNNGRFYLIHNDIENVVYYVRNQDTIKGNHLSGKQYEFCYGNNSCLMVRLSRKWNVIKPLWNTFITSDTISMLPIGEIKYVYNGDTIQFEGFESAYVGPKIVSLRKKKSKKGNQPH